MKHVTSIKIDKHIWKRVKKYCIDEELQISQYLAKIIEKDLAKHER